MASTSSLALGFLQWFDHKDPEKPRHAPLVLIPATLRRAGSTGEFQLESADGEMTTNLSLLERLKEDGIALPELPDAEELSPHVYCADVARAVARQTTLGVRPDVAVGALLVRQAHDVLGPEAGPLARSTLHPAPPARHRFVGAGFGAPAEPIVTEDESVDPLIDVATAGHVVDADSSQMIADSRSVGGAELGDPRAAGDGQVADDHELDRHRGARGPARALCR